jgi:hypothetical protein
VSIFRLDARHVPAASSAPPRIPYYPPDSSRDVFVELDTSEVPFNARVALPTESVAATLGLLGMDPRMFDEPPGPLVNARLQIPLSAFLGTTGQTTWRTRTGGTWHVVVGAAGFGHPLTAPPSVVNRLKIELEADGVVRAEWSGSSTDGPWPYSAPAFFNEVDVDVAPDTDWRIYATASGSGVTPNLTVSARMWLA